MGLIAMLPLVSVFAMASTSTPPSLPVGFGGDANMFLPPTVYGTEGWEGSIYYDNIAFYRPSDVVWEVSATTTAKNKVNSSKYVYVNPH